MRAGGAPAAVHVIRRGRVELSRKLHGRRVVSQVLHAGDIFGDVPLLVRMTEPFDATAIDDVVMLSADSVTLFRMLECRPRLALRWLVSLAMRTAAAQARLVDLLAGGLDAQLAALLVREAEGSVVRLPQALLAEMIGARRSSINRVLKRLETSGALRVSYGRVEIIDSSKLLLGAQAPGSSGQHLRLQRQ